MVRLRYFGRFSASRDGEPLVFPTKKAARLLAYVAREPGERVPRVSVGRTIWPDSFGGSEAVSLRTALTSLRTVVGRETFMADRENVWVERDPIESDLLRARRSIRAESIEPDPTRRAAILTELSELLVQPFLEGWEADWIDSERESLLNIGARATFDLARLHERANRIPEAREAAERALRLRPGDERVLALAMRIEVAAGDREAALGIYAHAENPSDDLRALAAEIRRTPVATTPARNPENADVLTAIEISLEENPEANARFLISYRIFPYFQSEVERAKVLYRRVLATPGVPPELRAPLLIMLARLQHRTADFDSALDLLDQAEALLDLGDPNARFDLLSLRASILQEARRWEESEEIIRDLIPMLVPGYRLGVALATLAVIEGQTGRLDAMRATSARALSLDLPGDVRYAFVCAHVTSNLAFLAIAEADWALAERYAGVGKAYFDVHPDAYGAAFSGAAYWLARAAQGSAEAASPLARLAGEPVRLGMRRVAVFVLDHVAEGLAWLGRGAAAVELLRAVERFRTSIHHDRSATEERNAARTREIARERWGEAVPPAPDDPSEGLGALALWAAERLEEPVATPR